MEAGIKLIFATDEEEFENHIRRKPKSQAELDAFAKKMEEYIDSQLEWDTIASEAAKEFNKKI